MHSYLGRLQYSNSLIAFVISVNFMFLCSYCATLGKLEGGGLGDVSCNSERDCVPNAYCIDSRYCTCKDEFVQDPAMHSCLPRARHINDPCKINIQCTSSFGTHSECRMEMFSEMGQCKCAKNAHFQDGLCYLSVHLGGWCKVSDDCVSLSNVPTYCAYSQCICAAGYHPTDDRLDCVLDVGLGKMCFKDDDCVADNSYCSGVCHCQSGYINSFNGSACLSAAKSLRSSCVEDSQCQRNLLNTFCDSQDKKCRCVPYSHEVDHDCWVSARLGEPCTHPNQCVTPSHNRSVVSCSHGVCACSDGHVRVDTDCTRLNDETAESSTLEKCIFLIVAALLLSLPSD